MSCPGVDVAAWKKANRAPLFPGKINRWALAHSYEYEPTPEDLRQQLAAVFSRWFGGSVIDPLLPFDGSTRSGSADLIRIINASKERLFLDPPVVRRREDLPYGPIPTLASGNIVYFEVHFAYRGLERDIGWPTTRPMAPVLSKETAECPVQAGWMLDRVGGPLSDAPKEMSTTEKVADVVTSGLNRVLGVVAVLALGYLAVHVATRKD